MPPRTPSQASLVIACGALAHEITTLLERNGWPHLKVECLPASLHNRPDQIAPAVRKKIRHPAQISIQFSWLMRIVGQADNWTKCWWKKV